MSVPRSSAGMPSDGAEPAVDHPMDDKLGATPGRWWGRPHTELLFQAEAMRLMMDPVFRGVGVPRGDGRPTLLVPGFVGGDYTLAVMATWLRRIGYQPVTCGFRVNVGCSERALRRVEATLETVHRVDGRRVALIGHSRGGYLAKALGALRPEMVSHVVALGSGLTRHLDVAVPGLAALAIARTVHQRAPERRERGCMTEACTCAFVRAYGGPFPASVRLTSIYSTTDGMVRWRSCIAPYADNVAITGSHIGMAVNRKAYRAIALALAEPPA